jgi:hypothetical protein
MLVTYDSFDLSCTAFRVETLLGKTIETDLSLMDSYTQHYAVDLT